MSMNLANRLMLVKLATAFADEGKEALQAAKEKIEVDGGENVALSELTSGGLLLRMSRACLNASDALEQVDRESLGADTRHGKG